MKLIFLFSRAAGSDSPPQRRAKVVISDNIKKRVKNTRSTVLQKGLHNAVHGEKLPVKKFPYFPYQPQAGKEALKHSKAGGKFSEQGERRIAQPIDGGYHRPVIFRNGIVLSGYFGAHFRFSASERFHRYFGFVHGSSVLAGSSFSSPFSFCGIKSL